MKSFTRKNFRRFTILFGCGGVLLIVFAFLSFLPVEAQPTSGYVSVDSTKEPDERIRRFFEELRTNGNSTKAFDDLFRSEPIGPVSGSPSIAEMKTKLDEIKNQFGEFKDSEKIGEKSVGKDLVIFRYLLKCDYHPVVWTFTFYRRPNVAGPTALGQWHLVGLRFDTNLDLLAL